jgi:hypothetical protein
MNREERIEYIKRKIDKKNEYLSKHPRASPNVVLRCINEEIKKRKLNNIIIPEIKDRSIVYEINYSVLEEAGKLDGCYLMFDNGGAERLEN